MPPLLSRMQWISLVATDPHYIPPPPSPFSNSGFFPDSPGLLGAIRSLSPRSPESQIAILHNPIRHGKQAERHSSTGDDEQRDEFRRDFCQLAEALGWGVGDGAVSVVAEGVSGAREVHCVEGGRGFCCSCWLMSFGSFLFFSLVVSIVFVSRGVQKMHRKRDIRRC